MARGNTLQKYM